MEPRDAAKGLIARITFYMHDRYGLTMSRQQQLLFMDWDQQFPVTDWEQERDRRIARIMGHANPFVTGDLQWTLGHTPSRAGLQPQPSTLSVRTAPEHLVAAGAVRSADGAPPTNTSRNPVHADLRSGTYFVQPGCPSYDPMRGKPRRSGRGRIARTAQPSLG